MSADIMKVDDQAKIDLFQEIMPIVMQYLAANSADDALIADDIIDFFALSIASVIQNDTNLTTRSCNAEASRRQASTSRTGSAC